MANQQCVTSPRKKNTAEDVIHRLLNQEYCSTTTEIGLYLERSLTGNTQSLSTLNSGH